MKLLMTGATGFIGKRVLRKLLSHCEKIYICVRPKSISKFEKSFGEHEKIQIIASDITYENLFFSDTDKEIIKAQCDSILHLAALYDLTTNNYDAYVGNILGTQNILSIAKEMPNLKTLHYISTIAVCGEYAGRYPEDDLRIDVEHGNSYGKTKMVAESHMRKTIIPGVKKRIYRPGIIIGEEKTGNFEKIDGPYYFLKLLFQMMENNKWSKRVPLIPLPYSKRAELPLVPVDILVDWLTQMVANPVGEEELKTYHLVSQHNLNVHRFIKESLKFAKCNATAIPLRNMKYWRDLVQKVGMPQELLGYMYSKSKFRPNNRLKDYPGLPDVNFESYKHNFFKGAKEQLAYLH